MTQQNQKAKTDDYLALIAVCSIVTAVAAVGILKVNRRHLKFIKSTYEANVEASEKLRATISSLRASGREFSYYPGVGLYLDKVYQY